MNILITQRHEPNKHGDWIDSLENEYVEFFESFEMNLVPVSNTSKNIAEMLSTYKPRGIILSGGESIGLSKEREKRESQLIDFAVNENIPVLGICRGMQFINVYFGGKLIDIDRIDKTGEYKDIRTHKIKIVNESLGDLLGGNREPSTNSYHEQGILKEGLGTDIGVFGVFEGLGLVEGLYHEKYPIAGVQWHPERKASSTALDKVLISKFLDRTLFWSDRH